MLGQLCVEPELELLEPEPDEPDELDDPELVLLDPEFELLELDDGVVVEELVLVLEPVVPVLDVLVVAASATSAPPVTRPVVNAPIANTFRIRIFMVCCPFASCDAPPRSERQSHSALRTCGRAHNDRKVSVGFPDNRVTIHSGRAWWQSPHSLPGGRSQQHRSRRSGQRLCARQQYARIGTSITSRPDRKSCSSRKRRIARRCRSRASSSMVMTTL
jgi:hypothetical protein